MLTTEVLGGGGAEEGILTERRKKLQLDALLL